MRVLFTGASGTVGQRLLPAAHALDAEVLTLGRRRPRGLGGRDRHVEVDLSDPAAVRAVRQRIAADRQRPIDAAVLAAGVDSLQGVADFDTAVAARVMQVTCFAHLEVLQGITAARSPTSCAVRVVAVSTDVVGLPTPRSVAYGAAKAALEEALWQATAEVPLRVLLVRLPHLGVPMREVAETGRRAVGGVPAPHPCLGEAAARVAAFLRPVPPWPGWEVWP